MTKLIVFPIGICVFLPSTSCKPKKQQHVPFFIFGDSLFDVGNNNYLNNSKPNGASLEPYGETYFNQPTGRYSNGRLIPDFIAQFAGMPLIPPFLQPGLHEYHHGVNFASAGAGALVGTNLANGEVINLHKQISNYRKVKSWFTDEFGSLEAKKRLTKAVHLFSVGLNDYGSPISTKRFEYAEMVIGNLSTVVKEIYRSGGRKFVLLTLLDMRCLPQSRLSISQGRGRHLEEAASLQKWHNKKLRKLFVELERNLDDFMYMIYGFNQSFQKRIRSPTKYGFKEEKVACCESKKFRGVFSCGLRVNKIKKYELCKNPDEYVFWDSAHPTQKMNEQMTCEMWRGGAHKLARTT